MSLRILGLALLVLVAPLRGQAEVRLPALFGDHMVLQRESRVRLWGWAAPGATVTASGSWNGATGETAAGEDGAFELWLETGPAGGPHELVVGDTRLTDVLLGEVWVASGQSNMEWNLAWTEDGRQAVQAADHPDLRLFTVGRVLAAEPLDDVEGAWWPCVPKVAARFSAVAYHFGRELLAALDGVPVGLVASSWGGTPAEAWTSARGLAGLDAFAEDLRRLEHLDDEPSLEELQAAWWRRFEAVDPGFAGDWMGAHVDGAAWRPARLPGALREMGLGDFDGSVWFRRTVSLPEDWVGEPLVLDLGPVDDMDVTFLNGRPVGATRVHGRWQTPRSYAVPGDVARAGGNVLAVCAVDYGGPGSVGRAGPVRSAMLLRLASQQPGEGIPLAGTWQARTGASLDELGPFPYQGPLHSSYPTALFNGMIAPLTPFTIRGVLWYQGESNRERAAQYRRLFPALIEDWRAWWGRDELPFYYVQIAPYAYRDDVGQAAELREAQALAQTLPHTGMVVTMDVGDPEDVHPGDKREVGRRLALWALANEYGRDVACRGPTLASLEIEGREARLAFDHAEGLTSGDAPPTCFTIAGDDRVFHPAEARVEGETVVVHSDAVPAPVAVRFAWGAADEPNLWNGAGLPASSFRTDDWPLVSRER